MVLTRLSHAGESCPLARGSQLPEDGAAVGPSSAGPPLGVFRQPFTPPSLTPRLHLLDLPVEVLQNILGYLSFAQICKVRLVCQRVNSVSVIMLTKSFHQIRSQTQQRFALLKSQMPRRESLRRKHPLVSQVDILDTLNMRLSLLYMTFGKHMDRKHICFFPGGILDEVHRLVGLLGVHNRLSIRITDELFDLSTMAMEHFKEQLEPRLPDLRTYGPPDEQLTGAASATYPNGSPGPGSTCASSVVGSSFSDRCNDWDDDDEYDDRCTILNAKLVRLSKSFKKSNTQLSQMKRDVQGYRHRTDEQSRLLAEYAARLDEHDKKYDETTHKLSNMVQELSECKSELQYWRCHSSQCDSCSAPLQLPPAAESAIVVRADGGTAAGTELSGSAAATFGTAAVGTSQPLQLPMDAYSSAEELRSGDDSDLEQPVTASGGANKRTSQRGKRKRANAAVGSAGDDAAAAAGAAIVTAIKSAGQLQSQQGAGSAATAASSPHQQCQPPGARGGKVRAIKRGKMC